MDSATTLALIQTTNILGDANASEEDKIKAMMWQSTYMYHPIHYSKETKEIRPLPAKYVCYRCGKAGHHIRNCTLPRVKDPEAPKPMKTTKGIPLSFMVKAEPGTKGAMLTMTGEYVVPAIDAQAYAKGKKERPPFVPCDSSSSEEDDPIPDELSCPICTSLMIDAVVIPCCGNSYCDKCIRTFLLDTEEHICFTCQRSGVSPDHLVANKSLRRAVNNYNNDSGCTVYKHAPVHHPAPPQPPPPPRLQLLRPLHSRQQDPLKVNVPQTSAAKPATPPPPITLTTTSSPPQIPITNPTPVAPNHSEGGRGNGHWYRNGGEHHSSRLQPAQPPAPVPPVYPAPALYGPPPQPYLPPYTSGPGIIPPPIIYYQPQSVYPPGHPVLHPPWRGHGSQPPHLPLPRPLPQPSVSKEDFYRPRHHRMEKAPSKLDESTKDFHKELKKDRNAPKRRQHYSSRSRSRSRSHSRSRSRSHSRSCQRSPISRHNRRYHGH